MTIPKINSAHGSDTRNILNRVIDSINVQGKSIQDLVANGQLSPTQYATLIQSVNGLISKGDISVLDIDKNLGKFDATYFSSDFLEELNNGTVNATEVLPGSIKTVDLASSIVVPEKTNFFKRSTNLLNHLKMSDHKTISPTTGGLEDSESLHSASDFIAVQPETIYSTRDINVVAFYDKERNFIERIGVVLANEFTTPSNAYEIRVTTYIARVGVSAQINLGSAVKPFELFYEYIPKEKVEKEPVVLSDGYVKTQHIGEKQVTPETTDFLIETYGYNLFDKNNPGNLEGKYLQDGGRISTNPIYVVSHFIPVKENKKYTNNSESPFKTNDFYDDNKIPIGSTTSNVFETIPKTAFIRVNLLLSELNTAMVYEGEAINPVYTPYKKMYKFSEEIVINPSNTDGVSKNELSEYNRIYSISDAINKWEKGEKFPIAFMGDSTTDGVRVTGNVNNTIDTIGTDHIEPKAYPYLLEQKLKERTNNNSLRIYNAGFASWRTTSGLREFANVFSDDSAYSDTKMVGFVFGINDRGVDPDNFKNNLIGLCLAAYAKGIQPFLVTPQAILQGGHEDLYSVQTATQLTTVISRAIKDVGKEFNIEVIDMNKATNNFISNAEISINEILPDTLHFGDAGHKYEAEFLYCQFIGQTINVEADTYISVTNPYARYSMTRDSFGVEPGTFKRYISHNALTTERLLLKADILNSSDRKLILNLDVSSDSNYYIRINGVKKLPSEIVELEIGHHEIVVYAGVGTTGKYYGFSLNKK